MAERRRQMRDERAFARHVEDRADQERDGRGRGQRAHECPRLGDHLDKERTERQARDIRLDPERQREQRRFERTDSLRAHGANHRDGRDDHRRRIRATGRRPQDEHVDPRDVRCGEERQKPRRGPRRSRDPREEREPGERIDDARRVRQRRRGRTEERQEPRPERRIGDEDARRRITRGCHSGRHVERIGVQRQVPRDPRRLVEDLGLAVHDRAPANQAEREGDGRDRRDDDREGGDRPQRLLRREHSRASVD